MHASFYISPKASPLKNYVKCFLFHPKMLFSLSRCSSLYSFHPLSKWGGGGEGGGSDFPKTGQVGRELIFKKSVGETKGGGENTKLLVRGMSLFTFIFSLLAIFVPDTAFLL